MRDYNQTLARTVLARMHFFDRDIEKPVSVLSGGERVKVTLAKLLLSDINTLVLDEPTNYLDIEAMQALEVLLQALKAQLCLCRKTGSLLTLWQKRYESLKIKR